MADRNRCAVAGRRNKTRPQKGNETNLAVITPAHHDEADGRILKGFTSETERYNASLRSQETAEFINPPSPRPVANGDATALAHPSIEYFQLPSANNSPARWGPAPEERRISQKARRREDENNQTRVKAQVKRTDSAATSHRKRKDDEQPGQHAEYRNSKTARTQSRVRKPGAP